MGVILTFLRAFVPRVLTLLAKVPWWCWLVLGLLVWGGAAVHRHNAFKADLVERTAKLEKEQRDEERARNERQAKALDKLQADAAQSALDRDRARAAEQRVRKQLDEQIAAGRAASADPAAAAGWSAAAKIGGVLKECVARYRELGEEADRAREAGLACEASYDALNPK